MMSKPVKKCMMNWSLPDLSHCSDSRLQEMWKTRNSACPRLKPETSQIRVSVVTAVLISRAFTYLPLSERSSPTTGSLHNVIENMNALQVQKNKKRTSERCMCKVPQTTVQRNRKKRNNEGKKQGGEEKNNRQRTANVRQKKINKEKVKRKIRGGRKVEEAYFLKN